METRAFFSLVGGFFFFSVIGSIREEIKERQKKSRGTMKQSKGKTIKADACSTASGDLYQIPQIERVRSREQ